MSGDPEDNYVIYRIIYHIIITYTSMWKLSYVLWVECLEIETRRINLVNNTLLAYTIKFYETSIFEYLKIWFWTDEYNTLLKPMNLKKYKTLSHFRVLWHLIVHIIFIVSLMDPTPGFDGSCRSNK